MSRRAENILVFLAGIALGVSTIITIAMTAANLQRIGF